MVIVSKRDKEILRELAKQIAETAALTVQQETKNLWKALNALKPVRPMVMIDQIPWHEMDVDGELVLHAESSLCRSIEDSMRKTLYSWKHMRADMVVEPYVDIPKVVQGINFGIRAVEERAVLDPKNDVVGHYYIDQLQTEEDLQKIRMPEVVYDAAATVKAEEQAHEIFHDILEVRMQGVVPQFAPWDRIAEWRGVQNLLLDMADRPEFMHAIISRLTNAYLSLLDQLEAKGLLAYGQATVHCSGAYTDELPAPGFDAAHPRAKDLWTSGMAQIFATVSPGMHEEFDIDYAVKWYSRFGLVYYGCCEPLHNKLDIIRKIPNLRKISMSPWVDIGKGAERIGHNYVFSRKPSPAFLAGSTWEPEAVEIDLQDTLNKCSRYGCPTEFILKDISTVQYQPQRLWEWAEKARKVVEG